MGGWTSFYDPRFYEAKVGWGGRVDQVYVNLLRDCAGKIIEYGSGTAEVVIALAEAGHDVQGVEISQQMFDYAKERLDSLSVSMRSRVRLERADFVDYVADPSVECIIIPNEGLAHVLSLALLERLFANIRRSLQADGMVLLDIPQLQPRLAPGAVLRIGPNESMCEGYYPLGSNGEYVRVSKEQSTKLDPVMVESVFRYEHISSIGELTKTIFRKLVQRLWTRDEVMCALRLNGLVEPSVVEVPTLTDRWFIKARASARDDP